MAYVAGLLADFDRCLAAGPPDPVRDGAVYQVAAIWLTDTEFPTSSGTSAPSPSLAWPMPRARGVGVACCRPSSCPRPRSRRAATGRTRDVGALKPQGAHECEHRCAVGADGDVMDHVREIGELRGQSVRLRPFVPEEADDAWEGLALQDESAHPRSRAEDWGPTASDGFRKRIERSGKLWRGCLDLAIERRGRLVALIQARTSPKQTLPAGVFEIGVVVFRRQDRGKGSGREAVELLTTWLFEVAGVERVQAGSEAGNAAMRAVLEHLGSPRGDHARVRFPERRHPRRRRHVRRHPARVGEGAGKDELGTTVTDRGLGRPSSDPGSQNPRPVAHAESHSTDLRCRIR
jgi:RimJ/RimL family protein N-acetyltransferase